MSNTADNVGCAYLSRRKTTKHDVDTLCVQAWGLTNYEFYPCRTYFNHTITGHIRSPLSVFLFFCGTFGSQALSFYYIYMNNCILCYGRSRYAQRNVSGAQSITRLRYLQNNQLARTVRYDNVLHLTRSLSFNSLHENILRYSPQEFI